MFLCLIFPCVCLFCFSIIAISFLVNKGKYKITVRKDVSRNGAVTKCHADAATTNQSDVVTAVGRWTSSLPPWWSTWHYIVVVVWRPAVEQRRHFRPPWSRSREVGDVVALFRPLHGVRRPTVLAATECMVCCGGVGVTFRDSAVPGNLLPANWLSDRQTDRQTCACSSFTCPCKWATNASSRSLSFSSCIFSLSLSSRAAFISATVRATASSVSRLYLSISACICSRTCTAHGNRRHGNCRLDNGLSSHRRSSF